MAKQLSRSACCGALLKWRKRRKAAPRQFVDANGKVVLLPCKGPGLRAYVCDECGKPDR